MWLSSTPNPKAAENGGRLFYRASSDKHDGYLAYAMQPVSVQECANAERWHEKVKGDATDIKRPYVTIDGMSWRSDRGDWLVLPCSPSNLHGNTTHPMLVVDGYFRQFFLPVNDDGTLGAWPEVAPGSEYVTDGKVRVGDIPVYLNAAHDAPTRVTTGSAGMWATNATTGKPHRIGSTQYTITGTMDSGAMRGKIETTPVKGTRIAEDVPKTSEERRRWLAAQLVEHLGSHSLPVSDELRAIAGVDNAPEDAGVYVSRTNGKKVTALHIADWTDLRKANRWMSATDLIHFEAVGQPDGWHVMIPDALVIRGGALSWVERVEAGRWLVRDESGRFMSYGNSTFHRHYQPEQTAAKPSQDALMTLNLTYQHGPCKGVALGYDNVTRAEWTNDNGVTRRYRDGVMSEVNPNE